MKTEESFDKRKFLFVLLLLTAGACVLSMIGYTVYKKMVYKKGDTYSAVIEEAISISSNSGTVNTDELSETAIKKETDPRADWKKDRDGQDVYYMYVDYAKMKEHNSDFVAWIYGCGGIINHPIVECSDSQYYLKHDFDKKSSPYGCVYTETLDDIFIKSDTAIYGHHMKNNTMFYKFVEYKNEEYYREYPAVYIFTEQGDRRYEIFSAYYLPVSKLEELQKETEGMTKAQTIEHLKSRSLYDTGVEVNEDDYILTIVTCEYSTGNSRMVIHAKCSD